ncbi:hypothetical protein [Streptomyces sp. CA-111067]|uniref:hypothetical protein n=1 Tax=Streptomyces sp. CA-111067 TaxID=3240046 RepID=UPI003D983EE4
MRRTPLAAVALLLGLLGLLVSAAACTGGSGGSRADDSAPTAGLGRPDARPTATVSTPGDDRTTVSASTRFMLSHQRELGDDAPGPQGPLLVSEGSGRSMFVWETADGRECHGIATTAAMSPLTCGTDPEVGRSPRLRTIAATEVDTWNVVFGAEHETVKSVTCNGEPVAVHNIGTMTGGRRIVYAITFPAVTLGSLTVQVSRDGEPATERLPMKQQPGSGGHPVCR